MNWKPFAAAALLGLAVCTPLPAASLDRSAAGAKGEVSKEDARRAIAIFRRDPLNAQGEMTRPIIFSFAKDSPDVEVAMIHEHLLWFENKSLPKESRTALLVAYMAGTIQSQLDSGKNKHDPLAAAEQVIATYRQLQKANPKLKVREIEDLVDLQKRGKLAEHFKGS